MQNAAHRFSFSVARHEAGIRLDRFLVRHLAEYSRSALLKLVQEGLVLVEGSSPKAGYKVRTGEKVQVFIPPPPLTEFIPEPVDFQILFEDKNLLVIVKPPGLVVHPAAGHQRATLAHGLAHHCDSLPGLDEQRPGIVHRLDKDTSGIMLVAKTDRALRALSDDFKSRNVRKTYHAILLRAPSVNAGRVVAPIGRHPVKRKKMAVRDDGRYAATRWQVLERLPFGMCFVELDLETGRTHQIRVHMASLGAPVAGDELYGGKVPENYALGVERQQLHASTIAFSHPVDRQPLSFTAPLWTDMLKVLELLRRNQENPCA